MEQEFRDSQCHVPVVRPEAHNGRVESTPFMAARLRALLDERGWTNSHLAKLLAERTGKTKLGALRQVQQWLIGKEPNERNRQDLAAVFGLPMAAFEPARATQDELDAMEAEIVAIRAVAADQVRELLELRQLLLKRAHLDDQQAR